ncbi:MAG: NAD(P)H-hydrate dehydratase [Campylobacterales bacterium]|nr:NAD(P)H-hydrate dehydratase [Campylobacterales bacterium]
MQRLYDEVGSLDKRCYDLFGLSEDLLMEHAADGMADFIRSRFAKGSKIIVVCGSGNNGADGIALSRLLIGDYDIHTFFVKDLKAPMAQIQQQRAHAIGVKKTIELNECDVLVDAVFGTGFKGDLDYEEKAVLQTMNNMDAYKIACDVPSGLKHTGECDENIFVADVSLTMGALKKSMFSDSAKEFVGDIVVLDLGVPRNRYEIPSAWNVLDLEDLQLPLRNKKDSHKGTYGHLAVLNGQKIGASTLSAKAALRFGVGLVSLVGEKDLKRPHTIMHSYELPYNTTAIALGMGLGNALSTKELSSFLDNSFPVVADADIFHMEILDKLLLRENIVFTPHPKEFVALLKYANLADISVAELQEKRFEYVELFCKAYPRVVLLLKGANVLIGADENFYVNPHGTPALAKGGSGDVLSGLIGALLAQGYSAKDAAIHGSLAHVKLALAYKGNDFSLTPDDLIEQIGYL